MTVSPANQDLFRSPEIPKVSRWRSHKRWWRWANFKARLKAAAKSGSSRVFDAAIENTELAGTKRRRLSLAKSKKHLVYLHLITHRDPQQPIELA